MADAQNSYQFVKREKLRVEHEKNLIEIQLRQVEESESKRLQEDEVRNQQVRQLSSMYEEEKEQVSILKDAMIVQERRYKEKLVKFAQELENVGKRKSKNKERLYQAGMQIKATLNGLIDMIREHIASKHETLSLKILKPLLEQLHSKCDILESLVVDSLHHQRD